MAIGNYRRPEWLKISPFDFSGSVAVDSCVSELNLNTVCRSARCPNRAVCHPRRKVTFMILGDICTRHCAFCAVECGRPQAPDLSEPLHVAQAVARLELEHAIITSVTRDDLPDGGASQFACAITEIRRLKPDTTIEILVPDFSGSFSALESTVNTGPHIIGHNVDTVPMLYASIRRQSSYERSLDLLKRIKQINSETTTKSGLMLGLGESESQVIGVMADLRKANCDILTIGQYLAPSLEHMAPVRYIFIDEFERYRELGMEMGFRSVYSAPLVRSSYCEPDVSLNA